MKLEYIESLSYLQQIDRIEIIESLLFYTEIQRFHILCTFKELMFAVEEVAKLNIVGFDVNELSPVYDQTGRSTALACKLLREILLYFYK